MDEGIKAALELLIEEKKRKLEYYQELQEKITVEIGRLETAVKKV